MASVTSRIGIFCTSHVLTISPVVAAKAMTTIDHISGGRAVLNVVAGWFEKELDMFGVGNLDSAARYAYTAEWMEVLLRLWTQDETFDFEGEYIKVKDAYQQPKSIQSPRAPVMNAARSPVGHAFAARWADIAFVSIESANPTEIKAKVDELRQMANDNGREIQISPAVNRHDDGVIRRGGFALQRKPAAGERVRTAGVKVYWTSGLAFAVHGVPSPNRDPGSNSRPNAMPCRYSVAFIYQQFIKNLVISSSLA